MICTVGVDDKTLRDGFRSFPSGHASTSFAGFTYLSLYLAGKLHLFDRRGHAVTAWLCGTPLMAATLIAVSRTMDYRHHATDVIAGALLGLVISYWCYKLYYPPLSHPQSHKPFSPRIPAEHLAPADETHFGDHNAHQRTDSFSRFNMAPNQPHDEDQETAAFTKNTGHALDASLDYPERETVARV